MFQSTFIYSPARIYDRKKLKNILCYKYTIILYNIPADLSTENFKENMLEMSFAAFSVNFSFRKADNISERKC